MDGLGGHKAKRNKPDRERQILRYHLHVESSKYNKTSSRLTGTENKLAVISGGWGGAATLAGKRQAQRCIVQNGAGEGGGAKTGQKGQTSSFNTIRP